MNASSHGASARPRMSGPMMSRRGLLRSAGGAAVLGGMAWAGKYLQPEAYSLAEFPNPDLFLAAPTAGCTCPRRRRSRPSTPTSWRPTAVHDLHLRVPQRHRDDRVAAAGAEEQGAAHRAAVLGRPVRPGAPKDFMVQLTNLGLALRPDLFDAHTLHWHGFRNVIPFFDGEPTGSVSVPTGRDVHLRLPPARPRHLHVPLPRRGRRARAHGHDRPGVRPAAPGRADTSAATPSSSTTTATARPASTASSRCSSPRCGPSRTGPTRTSSCRSGATTAPTSPAQRPGLPRHGRPQRLRSTRSHPVATDGDGDLIAPAGHPDLQYQPLSSLVTATPGERVALRFANLGFREAAMTLAGIPMQVVGRDATPDAGSRRHRHVATRPRRSTSVPARATT